MAQQNLGWQVPPQLTRSRLEEQHYDFILTVPVMEEFVDAANAYGRTLKFFGIFAFAFFSGMIIVGIIDGRIYKIGIILNLFMLIFFAISLVFIFSRTFRHMEMMAGLYDQWPTWFPAVTSYKTALTLQWRRVTGTQLYGPGWETPCRLTVSNRGLELIRWVSGKIYTVDLPWKKVQCVRRTPHAIVVGTSAAGKMNANLYNGRGFKLSDVDDCVLVDTRAVADPDAFADWCRSRMLEAHPRSMGFDPHSREGQRLRFRRWLYGDDL